MVTAASAFPAHDVVNQLTSCVFTRLSELANADMLGNAALSKAIGDLVRELRPELYATDIIDALNGPALAKFLPALQVEVDLLCDLKPASPGSTHATGTSPLSPETAHWVSMLLVFLESLEFLLAKEPGAANAIHVLRGLLQMVLLIR